MNPNTGHLVDTSGMTVEDFAALKKLGYVEVPSSLTGAARRALASGKETTVDLADGGQLARWAAARRAERAGKAKKKARRKMAQQSRRRNRR